jgi:hypothetical protein
MNAKRKIIALSFATALLAACGGGASAGISGTYKATDGSASVTFSSGQAVFASAGHSQTFKASYTVHGNTITVHAPNGDVTFNRKPDGSLDSPAGKFTPEH